MVSFSQKISYVFAAALPNQFAYQPGLFNPAKICTGFLHQANPLRFCRNSAENFRIFSVGHPQVKISAKLLPSAVIMRMDYLCFCCICNLITCIQKPSGINHILIKDSWFCKTMQFVKYVSPVCRTHIGCKKCLDSQT